MGTVTAKPGETMNQHDHRTALMEAMAGRSVPDGAAAVAALYPGMPDHRVRLFVQHQHQLRNAARYGQASRELETFRRSVSAGQDTSAPQVKTWILVVAVLMLFAGFAAAAAGSTGHLVAMWCAAGVTGVLMVVTVVGLRWRS
jgi:hypothetical protein